MIEFQLNFKLDTSWMIKENYSDKAVLAAEIAQILESVGYKVMNPNIQDSKVRSGNGKQIGYWKITAIDKEEL